MRFTEAVQVTLSFDPDEDHSVIDATINLAIAKYEGDGYMMVSKRRVMSYKPALDVTIDFRRE